jgi:hypothetical protein
MRDDDKRRRRKRDKARRRERLAAKRHDDHPTDDEFKRLYQMGIAAGRTPVLTDDADGREFLLDLSPGVVERVPWSEVRELFGAVLGPRRHANGKKKSPHRRRLPVQHCHMETESALLVPRQDGQAVPGCVVTLMWCPDCPRADLVACTLTELAEAEPVWRPDLRDFLTAEAADLQAQAGDDDLGDDGELKRLFLEAQVDGDDRPTITLAGVPTTLDLSPGVVAGVPGAYLDQLVYGEVEPRMRTDLKTKYPRRRRREFNPDLIEVETCLGVVPPGSAVPRFMVSMWCWPRWRNAELVACTLDELQRPEPLWRPDLKVELKGYVAPLLARLADQAGDN